MKFTSIFPTAILVATGSSNAWADVKMPALFSDHMVLQRDATVPVWGWADAGESVKVSFAGQEKTATADATGKWITRLDSLKAGEPQVMTIAGKNSISITDVLVGEIWMGAGQSNMDFALGWKGTENLAAASKLNDPQLRYFDVPHKGSLVMEPDVAASWQLATPQTVKGWSAVLTYFGQDLRAKLNVPVGLIKSSYGGTPAAPWVSLEVLSKNSTWKTTAEKEIAAVQEAPGLFKAFPEKMATWISENNEQDEQNSSLTGEWATPDFDDSAWKDVEIPATPDKLGLKGGGVVWLRRSFDLPAAAAQKDFFIDTNWINDAAITVYFNGAELKPITPYDRYLKVQPRFNVAKTLILPGKANLVTIRLHLLTQNSSWWDMTRKMNLPVEDPKSLDDRWKFKVEKEYPPVSAAALASLPQTPDAKIQNTSSALLNAMIHPLIPYALKGVVWYQGESNTNTPQQATDYRHLLPALIGDWRHRWGSGDFPFYIVQLTNYGAAPKEPAEGNWALLRESQNITASNVPNSGVAVTIDVGNGDDIHPENKKAVGDRLALLALNRAYGEKQEDSGPIFDAKKVEGSSIRISFKNAGAGLEAKGGALKQFAIAGADKNFVWADAKIDGETVIVCSTKVPNPVDVRYAWADNPEGCNLYSKNGLPASPFRTDTP